MLSVVNVLNVGLLARKSVAGARLGDSPWDSQLLGVFVAVLVGLNLYMAVMHWRAYFLFLRIAVSALASLFLLGALCAIAGFYGLVIWLGMLVVVLTLIVQIARARRRATLDLLTLATEKRMPLPPLIKALAADHWAKARLLRLADNLERGMALSTAIKTDKPLLPREAMVAAEMGEATGNLAGALRQAQASNALSSHMRQSLLGHTFYLVSLAFFLPLVFGFVMIFIIPKYIEIFDDFSIDLPPLTVWAVRICYYFPWLAVALPILGTVVLLYMILCYADFLPLPILGFGRRFEHGRVLRAMALATDARRPLGETLAALAQSYPQPEIARRLEACAYEARAGANWTISLLKHGLIGVHDVALIDAAQRLGNLPWALGEVADGNQRRLIYRYEALLNVVAPLVMLMWGAIVMFFVVACFLPLVNAILALS